MKKQKVFVNICITSFLFAIFSLMSCGSAPKQEDLEPTPAEPVILEEEKEEPPVEEAPKVEEPEPAPEPEPDFSEANKSLLEKVETARTNAIESGAQENYPEIFDSADKEYELLKKNIDENSNIDYSAQIDDLVLKYEALAKASAAKAMKDRADEMGFSEFDKSAYEKGQSALDSFVSAQNGKDSLENANSAYDSYNLLLQKGFTALAGRERNAALAAKKNADSVKAGVAKKEEYTSASEMFKKADSSYVTKDIESAYNGYKTSKEKYTEIYEIVAKNRAAAQAALERAKQKVQEAESYSEEADGIAPLSEQVAGIESEDAVLLEEDNLADPDDAVIDVEDGETAKNAQKTASDAIAEEELSQPAENPQEAQ